MGEFTGTGNRVRIALLTDMRIGHAVLRVSNDQGVIVLQGTVETKTSRQLAEEIARQQPGVVMVINRLKVG